MDREEFQKLIMGIELPDDYPWAKKVQAEPWPNHKAEWLNDVLTPGPPKPLFPNGYTIIIEPDQEQDHP